MVRGARPNAFCRSPNSNRIPGDPKKHSPPLRATCNLPQMASPKPLKKSLPGLWRITKYFWPRLRQYRGLMTVSFLALLAEVVLKLLEPWPLKFVFDHV